MGHISSHLSQKPKGNLPSDTLENPKNDPWKGIFIVLWHYIRPFLGENLGFRCFIFWLWIADVYCLGRRVKSDGKWAVNRAKVQLSTHKRSQRPRIWQSLKPLSLKRNCVKLSWKYDHSVTHCTSQRAWIEVM